MYTCGLHSVCQCSSAAFIQSCLNWDCAGEDCTFEVDVDVMEACIKLQRYKYLRQWASRRVAVKWLCEHHLVCVEGVLNGWVVLALFLTFRLLRISYRSAKSIKVCVPAAVVVKEVCLSHLHVERQQGSHISLLSHINNSSDVETNPGPLDHDGSFSKTALCVAESKRVVQCLC